ncbi:hypothetical protein BBOV_III004080 [Babesia bovis T2Bo]|uniref:Uncharacterized protein n=1 Tax=Babesia bovis TaxID=5865 RepID=A7AN37_BABBO|nr:hypothetical protein BBOV_III004080 [Babesia bovis T2Bo]EDO07971.1 hypothetical protein BBOV_III004080 [Babesia bovis T2Bo]|eukprot:XP_001611539.1 hypothetical protein [Babesia bovis T2Bo]
MKTLSILFTFTSWYLSSGWCQGPQFSKPADDNASATTHKTPPSGTSASGNGYESVSQVDPGLQHHTATTALVDDAIPSTSRIDSPMPEQPGDGATETPQSILSDKELKQSGPTLPDIAANIYTELDELMNADPSARNCIGDRNSSKRRSRSGECWRGFCCILGNSHCGASRNKNERRLSYDPEGSTDEASQGRANPSGTASDDPIKIDLHGNKYVVYKDGRVRVKHDDIGAYHQSAVSSKFKPLSSAIDSNLPLTAKEEEALEPKIVASVLKSRTGERPISVDLGSINISVTPTRGNIFNKYSSVSQAGRGRGVRSSLECRLGTDTTDYPRCIVTRHGFKQLLDEVITIHRRRYIYGSSHSFLWMSIFPAANYRIYDSEACSAIERLHACVLARRPTLIDNVGRIMSLEKRINEVLSTVKYRFGMTSTCFSIQTIYKQIHEMFIGTVKRAINYFNAISTIITHLVDQYRSNPLGGSSEIPFSTPLEAREVDREVDRCKYDENYGTFINLRTCFNTWELDVLSLMYEMESISDEAWLNRLVTGQPMTDVMAEKMLQFKNRIKTPQCFHTLRNFHYERHILSYAVKLERLKKMRATEGIDKTSSTSDSDASPKNP